MNINTSIQKHVAILRLSGRFEFSTHREFRDASKAALQNSAVKEIQIDLGKVEYLDSSALGMLLLCRENALEVGKSIILDHPTGAVRQVLDIANFHKLFTIRT
jgi:HptB-dependent secretion and biofilm anti anti-sigma factor